MLFYSALDRGPGLAASYRLGPHIFYRGRWGGGSNEYFDLSVWGVLCLGQAWGGRPVTRFEILRCAQNDDTE